MQLGCPCSPLLSSIWNSKAPKKWGQNGEREWDFKMSAMLSSKVCWYSDGASD